MLVCFFQHYFIQDRYLTHIFPFFFSFLFLNYICFYLIFTQTKFGRDGEKKQEAKKVEEKKEEEPEKDKFGRLIKKDDKKDKA